MRTREVNRMKCDTFMQAMRRRSRRQVVIAHAHPFAPSLSTRLGPRVLCVWRYALLFVTKVMLLNG